MTTETSLILPIPNLQQQQALQIGAASQAASEQREMLRQAYRQAYDAGQIKALALAVELYGNRVADCPCCYEWSIERPHLIVTLRARIVEPSDIVIGKNEPWLEIKDKSGTAGRERIVCSNKSASEMRWIAGPWLNVVIDEAKRVAAAQREQAREAALEQERQVQMIQLAEELALARDLMQP